MALAWKGMAIGLAVVLAIGVMLFVILAIQSHRGAPPGLVDGRLAPPPSKPNCVCSEYPDRQDHYMPPVDLGDHDLTSINAAVVAIGGTVTTIEDAYLAATFTSPLFRFVDDVEVRLDREAGLVHFRSASRVGHSDMGANRRRMERLVAALQP